MKNFLKPNWPAPSNIQAYATLRTGGYSLSPYNSMNLAENVEDEAQAVNANRKLLRESLKLPQEPLWLQQIHGTRVLCADSSHPIIEADGSFAKTPHQVCVVTTADCLPILMTNLEGTVVAALHAGWRGLAAGIIEQGIALCKEQPGELLVWLGPAIGPSSFEVGEEVRACYIKHDPAAALAFQPSPAGRWLADLYLLAKQRLASCGVTKIYGGDFDTYRDAEKFFSYRRDGVTGRMASLIWMNFPV